jgi:hypothetical protein
MTISIPEKPDASIFRVRDGGGMLFKKVGKHLSPSTFKTGKDCIPPKR